MGLLDRLRSRTAGVGGEVDATEQDALRLIDEGNLVEDQGRLAEALERYDAAVRAAPQLARAHLNRGNVLLAMGKTESALETYAAAIAQNPEYSAAHFNMGNAYLRSDRPESALECYRKALAFQPDFADAEVAMGVVLQDLGRLDDAVSSYRRALAVNPDHAEAHSNLGSVLGALGLFSEAMECYRQAVTINPKYVEGHYLLGNILQSLGRFEDAVASYRKALAINPNHAEAHNNLGNVQERLGDLEEGEASYRRAFASKPDFAEAHTNLGNTQLKLGLVQAAIASQQRALAINPNFAEAHCNLGDALRDSGQTREAISSYSRALEIKPDFAHVHVNLGNIFNDLGRLDDAVVSFRRAIEINPQYQEAYTCLLFGLSHNESITPEMLYAEHCSFGERFEAPVRASWPEHRNGRNPDRVLQVGFVSGDLRAHPIAYFIEPLLTHLAGYPTLSLHAYSNHAREDGVTGRLRHRFKHWHRISGLSDAELAQKVGEDGIDILIDLSGHTGEHRLLTFARKAAPVQASWMGYPGTTGLRAMDYYFADRHFLPTNEFAGQFTEKLVHLPANVPFLPDENAPPVNSLPALTNGFLTFGSFNRLSKLRPAVIALWSRLLRAIPDAQLVVGGMPQEGQHNPLPAWFAREGIARERLRFYPRSDTATYLRLHHQVDMCLDTFPYSGGTTTAHALWMGVTTLSMGGHTPAGRQGAAFLGHVGLTEFLANDAADFERKGACRSSDLGYLARIRAGLRERCEQSTSRRPELIAAGLERALRIMWQRWCAGLPPEAFEVSPPIMGNAMPKSA